jgi:phage/plasmid-like protein (TIGR03299 family)
MSESTSYLAPNIHQGARENDAVFLGWQTIINGELIPLYTVTVEGHPLFHSTVSDVTLRKMHLRIPHTPSPYPSAKPSPWHRIGTALNHPATGSEAIEAAGLNYTIVKEPLKPHMGMMHAWALVRTDTRKVLGVVGDSYVPLQNKDAFAFFDPLMGKLEATYEIAGTLDHGKNVWLLARLPGFIRVRSNDIVHKYLLIIYSHGGRSSFRVKPIPIRAICNNALTAAIHGAEEVKTLYAQYTGDDLQQIDDLREWIDSIYKQLDAVFNRMAIEKISEKQLMEYVKTLVPDSEGSIVDAEADEIRNAILGLHTSGQGASLAPGTLWGALNSVVEYADHFVPGKESEEFNRKERLKLKAFHMAEHMLEGAA